MAYQLYTKNELGEIVAVTPGIDERVSNLETKAIELDNYKVDTREQTLTTEQKEQVVKNLDGTFLPLSGGTLTGSIKDTSGKPIQSASSDSQVTICGGTKNEDGAWIELFGNTIDDPRKGTFTLSSGDSSKSLYGYPDGRLQWEAKEVERVTAKGSNYIRYDSGLQICWGSTTSVKNSTHVFPVPFKNVPSCFASINSYLPEGRYLTIEASATQLKIYKVAENGGYWGAIGFWK